MVVLKYTLAKELKKMHIGSACLRLGKVEGLLYTTMGHPVKPLASQEISLFRGFS
jgi:hypothetical protein